MSKLIIETLQDLLSPYSSSQLSSSCLSQSSWISHLASVSSLPRSNLPSVKPFSKSSSSQSLSATATRFNPKCQNCMLSYPTLPKFETLSTSPPFRQVFSSPIKTTSDYMSSTEVSKLVTSLTSISSSFKTPRPSQLKFQPPSSITSRLLSTVVFLCAPTFPSSPILTALPSFSAPPPTSRHHYLYLVPTPSTSCHHQLHCIPTPPTSCTYTTYVLYLHHLRLLLTPPTSCTYITYISYLHHLLSPSSRTSFSIKSTTCNSKFFFKC